MKGDKLALWVDQKDDYDAVLDLGCRWIQAMELETNVDLEFAPHDKSVQMNNSRLRGSVGQHSALNWEAVKERLSQMK